MSDTPRTDAAVKLRLPDGLYWVDPNFARQLERELNEERERCEMLSSTITSTIKILKGE